MTFRRGLALAVGALAVAPSAALGLDGQVEPDRPSVSTSAKTVPAGAVQIESGVDYSRASLGGSRPERRLVVEATGRVGIVDGLEARVDAEPLVHLRGAEHETDVGDVTLGLKYRFLDATEGAWWPSLGLLPFIKLPVADEPIGSGRPDVGVRGLASFDLPAKLGLDVNVGLVAVGQPRRGGYLLQALVSAAVSREIVERLSAFAELFYASREERSGRDSTSVDAGLTWFVTRRLALDVAVATSLAGQGPDYALRAGFSVRFGR